MHRKYKVFDDFFAVINSEEKAYLLGFFLADGTFALGERCTNSYKFSVRLQEEDKDAVDLFRRFIIPDKDLFYKNSYIDKNNVSHKGTYYISWTSTKMAVDLIGLNITPRKTYDTQFKFPFEKIPKEFIWDFIRGFFDGDGQFSYSSTSHSVTFALYGTSKDYMDSLGELFESEFENITKRVEGVTKSSMILYTLRFSANFKRKEFINQLYTKFYLGKNYFLKRKQEKMLEYLLFKYRDNSEDIERLQSIVERRR